MRPSARHVALVLLLWACAVTGDAGAHTRSESFSHWRYEDGTVTLRFTVGAREVTRLAPADQGSDPGSDLAHYLSGRIEVQDRQNTCRPVGALRWPQARTGYVQVTGRWHCDGPPVLLVVDAFFDRAAEHAHFATLEIPAATLQRLFTRDRPAWHIDLADTAGSPGSSGFSAFVGLGFRHIITGPDHLLFLLLLLIACRRARELPWAVTGFTLGHSVTLGLAAAGIVQPNLPVVEATIGLTIALVAMERAACSARQAALLAILSSTSLLLLAPASHWLGGPAPGFLAALALFALCYLLLARATGGHGAFRMSVTTLFGLVHGMGFATAFLANDLDPGAMLWPLAGFNVGVELGQLAVVALMGGAALALRVRPRLAAVSGDLGAAAGCASGVYWFLLRGFS